MDGFEYNNYYNSGSDRDKVGIEETKLESLIKEIKMSMENAKGFWTRLPYNMCKGRDVEEGGGVSDFVGRKSGSGRRLSAFGGRGSRRRPDRHGTSEEEPELHYGRGDKRNHYTGVGDNRGPVQQCWNGSDAGKYLNTVVGDGFTTQELNPEVQVDVSRPDVDINEQIFALKLITKKLESAYNGQPVEWSSSPSRSRKSLLSTELCKMISRNRFESRVTAPSGRRHTLRATYCL